MGFYEIIEKYYDAIFPTKPAKVAFVERLASWHEVKSLLDIGSATGGFAAQIAEHIERIEAFDLDEQMVQRAKTIHQKENLHFRVGNMLDVDQLYAGQTFDMVTCFGNTLVHIKPNNVCKVFKRVKSLLDPNGVFILQILNYDYILGKGITTLPLIDNDIIRFERYYDLSDEQAILFQTKLEVKENDEAYHNVITLYPISKEAVTKGLKDAGFRDIECYKNYQGEAFGGEHLPLIIVAR